MKAINVGLKIAICAFPKLNFFKFFKKLFKEIICLQEFKKSTKVLCPRGKIKCLERSLINILTNIILRATENVANSNL